MTDLTEKSDLVLLQPAPAEILLPENESDKKNAIALPEGLNLPQFITDAGEQASRRFINFFTKPMVATANSAVSLSMPTLTQPALAPTS